MAFVKVGSISDLPQGSIREFDVNGKAVAIAHVDGTCYAINAVCLHQGGPLGDGELAGKTVICPWHAWEYDLTTGKLTANPAVGVESYPVDVRGGEIFVDVG